MIGHMKTEVTTLNKPNITLVMAVRTGKITAVERKLYNALLFSSARQLRLYREINGSEPDNKHLYSALASDLLKHVEVGKSNLKSMLRKHVLALRRAEIDWEAPDAKSGVIWSNMNPLSQASFKLINGNLHVFWALPPDLNAALSDTVAFPYTALVLEEAAKLKSYTAVALYDICARYRNNYRKGGDGDCLTSANSPDWWISSLTNVPPKVDKDGQPVLREWRKVKNESVKDAIEEINEKSDLFVELIEKKAGRAVSSIQFSVRQKKQAPKEVPSNHFELIRTGARLGLGDAIVEASLQNNSPETVALALARLEGRLNNKELGPVENVRRYFVGIMKDQQPIALVEDSFTPTERAKAASTDLPEAEKSTHTLAREEFMGLTEAQKSVYGAKAVERLEARGLATSRVLLNAKEGVWSGVLLSEMVAIYSAEKALTA